jgi:hypothetical protein
MIDAGTWLGAKRKRERTSNEPFGLLQEGSRSAERGCKEARSAIAERGTCTERARGEDEGSKSSRLFGPTAEPVNKKQRQLALFTRKELKR